MTLREVFQKTIDVTHEHKACYGSRFHDTLHFNTNEEMKGKFFGFELDAVCLGRSNRMVEADIAERDDCPACAEFEH